MVSFDFIQVVTKLKFHASVKIFTDLSQNQHGTKSTEHIYMIAENKEYFNLTTTTKVI